MLALNVAAAFEGSAQCLPPRPLIPCCLCVPRDPPAVTISNDGATIIKLLDIVHPAAKTLVDIARSQDVEVGDGTTTVTLLAGEFLRNVKVRWLMLERA